MELEHKREPSSYEQLSYIGDAYAFHCVHGMP